MERRELICIGCPLGCSLTVSMEGAEVVSVTGNTCKRGDVYARKEVTNPTRIVTSTVKVSNGTADMVSVKTKEDVPKEKIFDCMRALKDVTVQAPVHIGDVVLKNVAGTGVDMVATKKMWTEGSRDRRKERLMTMEKKNLGLGNMNGMTDQDHRTCGINDMNCLGGEEKEQTLNDMNGVSREDETSCSLNDMNCSKKK